MMRPNSTQQSGFSLIELSILIAILSVVLTSILTSRVTKQETQRTALTQTRMKEIHKAITQYYFTNGYLPCAASRLTDATTTAALGAAVDCSLTTAIAGTQRIDTTATNEYQMIQGALPSRTLGIPDDMMLDGWGNRFTYIVTRRLAIDKATFDAYNSLQTTNYTEIRDNANNLLYGSTNKQVTAYLLISHGVDGRGAYNVNGSMGLVCGTATRDSENCDEDNVFVKDYINDAQTGATYFYDFIDQISLQTLRNKAAGY